MGFLGDILNIFFPRPKPTPPPPVVVPPSYITSLLNLHNSARPATSQLVPNTTLQKAAQSYAELMAKNSDLDHYEAGTPVDRARQAGYNSTYVGENIEEGSSTPEAVFNIWMKSASHHANIVNLNYKDVGFGYALSSNGTPYWCVDFGRIW